LRARWLLVLVLVQRPPPAPALALALVRVRVQAQAQALAPALLVVRPPLLWMACSDDIVCALRKCSSRARR
jgi:hypothetical protein